MPNPPFGKKGTSKGPSLRGALMLDVSHGALRARAWPSSRGKNLHPTTKAQNDHFRLVQWAWKYAAAEQQMTFTQARKGTPLLPRDLWTAMLANTLVRFTGEDGVKRYPVQAQQAVSDSLDSLGQTVGFTLVRKEKLWTAEPPIIANRAGAVLKRASAINIGGTGSYILVDWESAPIDQIAGWDPTQPSELKILIAGWYSFNFITTRDYTSPMDGDIEIIANNVPQGRQTVLPMGGGIPYSTTLTALVYCAANDIIQCRVRSYYGTGSFSGFTLQAVGNA